MSNNTSLSWADQSELTDEEDFDVQDEGKGRQLSTSSEGKASGKKVSILRKPDVAARPPVQANEPRVIKTSTKSWNIPPKDESTSSLSDQKPVLSKEKHFPDLRNSDRSSFREREFSNDSRNSSFRSHNNSRDSYDARRDDKWSHSENSSGYGHSYRYGGGRDNRGGSGFRNSSSNRSFQSGGFGQQRDSRFSSSRDERLGRINTQPASTDHHRESHRESDKNRSGPPQDSWRKPRSVPVKAVPEPVVPRHTGPRETGILSSIKGDFGVIKCAERDVDIFVSFSQFPKNHEPKRDDEVSFYVVKGQDRHGKPSERAEDVIVLRKGTVVFEEELAADVEGIVEAPLKMSSYQKHFNQQKSPEGFGGRIRITNTNVKADAKLEQTIFQFASRDVVDARCQLSIGDIVKFSIFLEKRSGRKGATNVILVKRNCRRGIVTSVPKDKDFGFVSVIGDHKPIMKDNHSISSKVQHGEVLFFRFSQLMRGDEKHKFKPDDELEFVIVDNGREKPEAQKITLLEKGTLPRDVVSKTVYHGVLKESISVRHKKRSTNHNHDRKVEKGIIILQSDSLTEVTFDANNVVGKIHSLYAGDVLSFNLVTNIEVDRPLDAQNIKLEKINPDNREMGIVRAVKMDGNSGFSFIECLHRKESDLFLHLDEVIGTPKELEDFKVGTEVQFNVTESGNNKKMRAERAVILPKGTVVLYHVSPDVMTGKINKEISRDEHNEFVNGEIVIDDADLQRRSRSNSTSKRVKSGRRGRKGSETEQKHTISIPFGDPKEKEEVHFFVGDTVMFQYRIHIISEAKTAVNVKFISMDPSKRESGVIASISEERGFIRCAKRRHLAMFNLSDFMEQPQRPLKLGDCLEFNITEETIVKERHHHHSHNNHHHYRNHRIQFHAHRIKMLQDESVIVESIDEQLGVVYGKITHINPSGTGHIEMISEKKEIEKKGAVKFSPHPASIHLKKGPKRNNKFSKFKAEMSHPASLTEFIKTKRRKMEKKDEKEKVKSFSFHVSDFFVENAAVYLGDLVSFRVATFLFDPSISRAVEINFVAVRGTVTNLTNAFQQKSNFKGRRSKNTAIKASGGDIQIPMITEGDIGIDMKKLPQVLTPSFLPSFGTKETVHFSMTSVSGNVTIQEGDVVEIRGFVNSGDNHHRSRKPKSRSAVSVELLQSYDASKVTSFSPRNKRGAVSEARTAKGPPGVNQGEGEGFMRWRESVDYRPEPVEIPNTVTTENSFNALDKE